MNLRVLIPSCLVAVALTGLVLLVVSHGLAQLFHWVHSLSPSEALGVRLCLAAIVALAVDSGLVAQHRRDTAVA